MAINTYETQLTGGHPNSLGNTIHVVEDVLTDKKKLKNLYVCYRSDDEVVRLRVSNAMKRICREHPEWVAEYLDGLTGEIAQINQPSTKWTMATLYVWLDAYMNEAQRAAAIAVMQHNMETEKDWIVQNTVAESLAYFAERDNAVKDWLLPRLERQLSDPHKSVSRRAEKLLKRLAG